MCKKIIHLAKPKKKLECDQQRHYKGHINALCSAHFIQNFLDSFYFIV